MCFCIPMPSPLAHIASLVGWRQQNSYQTIDERDGCVASNRRNSQNPTSTSFIDPRTQCPQLSRPQPRGYGTFDQQYARPKALSSQWPSLNRSRSMHANRVVSEAPSKGRRGRARTGLPFYPGTSGRPSAASAPPFRSYPSNSPPSSASNDRQGRADKETHKGRRSKCAGVVSKPGCSLRSIESPSGPDLETQYAQSNDFFQITSSALPTWFGTSASSSLLDSYGTLADRWFSWTESTLYEWDASSMSLDPSTSVESESEPSTTDGPENAETRSHLSLLSSYTADSTSRFAAAVRSVQDMQRYIDQARQGTLPEFDLGLFVLSLRDNYPMSMRALAIFPEAELRGRMRTRQVDIICGLLEPHTELTRRGLGKAWGNRASLSRRRRHQEF